MSSERREYYRIDDILPMYHTAIPTAGVGSPESDIQAMLGHMDTELHDAIAHAFQADPVIGRAIGMLNRKLSVLGSMLAGKTGSDANYYAPTPVNLSGSGIAFDSADKIPIGERRRIHVLLQPSQLPLQLDSTVQAIESSDDTEKPFRIRLEFDHDDVAREEIIRYVVQRQSMVGTQ